MMISSRRIGHLENQHVSARGGRAVVQEPLAGDVVLAVQTDDLNLRDAVLVRDDDANGKRPLHVGVGGVVGDEFEGLRGGHLE